jgi:hypothetical protein
MTGLFVSCDSLFVQYRQGGRHGPQTRCPVYLNESLAAMASILARLF